MAPSWTTPRHLERDRTAERRARECAGEQDVALRAEVVHHVGPPRQHRDRDAVAERLAHRGEIGQDAVPALRAADAVAEAGDHLVEDQEGPGCRAGGAERLEEPGLRQDDAGIVEDRLDDHRRDRVALALEELPDTGSVVVFANLDEVPNKARNAGRRRDR